MLSILRRGGIFVCAHRTGRVRVVRRVRACRREERLIQRHDRRASTLSLEVSSTVTALPMSLLVGFEAR